MVAYTMVNTLMIKSKVWVPLPGQTDGDTSANGLTENKKEKVNIHPSKILQRRVNGKMENVLHGYEEKLYLLF